MALKELLVHLNQAKGAGQRLRLAMELAKRHASHLTALFVEEWSSDQLAARAVAELGLAAAADLSTLDRSVAADIEAAASRLRISLDTFKAARALDADWKQRSGFSDVLLRKEAPYTDLTVIGHENVPHSTLDSRAFCEKLLCETGGPLLIVPTETPVGSLGRRVVVAWDGSAPALHALNHALPVIERADQTTIVNVSCGINRITVEELGRLMERLQRHGGSVNVRQFDAPANLISELLQSKARDLGADLIVCGAFGHHRLKEHLLGGVTFELLQHLRLPLLISK